MSLPPQISTEKADTALYLVLNSDTHYYLQAITFFSPVSYLKFMYVCAIKQYNHNHIIKMNKSYLTKNILIVSAIIAMVLLVSTGCKDKATESGQSQSVASKGIAYVELDSVIAHFDMAIDKTAELTEKQTNSEAELTAKSQAFDRDVRDYQTKVTKGLVTRATAAEIEQTLQQQQQNLLALRDEMAYNLNEESVVAQRQVLEYINMYLAEYNKDHNFQFILAKQFPGPILYSDTALDITPGVTEGLNAKYAAEKAK